MLAELTKKSWLKVFSRISRPFSYIFHRIIFGKNAALTAISGINKTNIPTMIIHGKKDNVVDINGPSIISKKRQITSNKVIYDANEKGHLDVFRTEDASEYMKALDFEYEQLNNKYNGNIPDGLLSNYYSKIDKRKYCELNMELMNTIQDFYLNNL